jgi:hypothetical protein
MSPYRLLLTPGEFQESFRNLLKRSSKLQLASAWATMGHPLDLISQYAVQTTSFIGTSFSATSPDALEALSKLGKVYIDERTDRVFHPKVYLFQVSDGYVAIIGSPNFTDAAFTRNEEVAIQLELDRAAAQSLLKYFIHLQAVLHALTPQVLERYRKSYRPPSRGGMARRAKIEGPKQDSGIAPSSFAVRGQLLRDDWQSYYDTLKDRSRKEHKKESLYNPSGSYLETLRRLDPILQIPFTKLSGEELRKVMGDKLEGYDYGWFGSLKANGQGRHEILKNDVLRDFLRKFLPKILAAKTKEDSLQLAEQLFERLVLIKGIKQATPTRLLAIYRPDLFFSVNNPSIERLSLLFGKPKATLRCWEGYAQALQMIWRAEWYRSSRPSRAKEGRAWDARVALLDAYAYNADERE